MVSELFKFMTLRAEEPTRALTRTATGLATAAGLGALLVVGAFGCSRACGPTASVELRAHPKIVFGDLLIEPEARAHVGDAFVVLDEDRALVGGSLGLRASSEHRGVVFVMDGLGTRRGRVARPRTDDAPDRFGGALAVGRGFVAIADPLVGKEEPPGRVFVFDPVDLSLRATLTATTVGRPPGERVRFGRGLAAAGSWLWIGATTAPAGAVYGFEAPFEGGPGRVLEAPEGTRGFGEHLAASAHMLLVGACGGALVYEAAGGRLVRRLGDIEAAKEGCYAARVALADDAAIVVVGRGPAARVEAFVPTTGASLRRFDAPDGVSRDFGARVATCGDSVLVADGTGRRVHVYDRASGRRASALGPPHGAARSYGWELGCWNGRPVVMDPDLPAPPPQVYGRVYVYDEE